MLGFIDAYWFIMWSFIILAPVLFILRRRSREHASCKAVS